MAAEGVELDFTEDGTREIARLAAEVNGRMENIGARRLHTVMTTLLDEILFSLPDENAKRFVINAEVVRERLRNIVDDEDLRRYIL